MKKYSMLCLCIMLSLIHGYAQCPSWISTNPQNPRNFQVPSKINNFFDWQSPTWDVQASSNCFRSSSISSPFHNGQHNLPLTLSKDMKWEDGWELIYRGLGLDDHNQVNTQIEEHLYVILYNRYTGILRVILQTCRGEDYNAAKISLSFAGESDFHTDLLSMSREHFYALDRSFTNTAFNSISEYTNQTYKWFYADFPMAYDPCTCRNNGIITIKSELISNSNISLNGSLNGEALTQNGSVTQSGSHSFKNSSNIQGKLKKTHESTFKFLEQAKKMAEVAGDNSGASTASNSQPGSTASKKKGSKNLVAALNLPDFLKAGLQSIPFLESAMALFDMFAGGGKKSSDNKPIEIMPLTINLTASLSGTISEANVYHNIDLFVPGGKDNSIGDPSLYPYYDEVLGVFNLIKTPEVYHERRMQNLDDIYPFFTNAGMVNVDRFKLKPNTFKYVFNPSSGMVIDEMKMAFVVEGQTFANNYITNQRDQMNPDFPMVMGTDSNSGAKKFSTKFLHSKCFEQKIFKSISAANQYSPTNYYGVWSKWRPNISPFNPSPTVFVKVMLNLRPADTGSSDKQNVLFVATFPAKVVPTGYMHYWPSNDSCNDTTRMPGASMSEINSLCNSFAYTNNRLGSRPHDNDDMEEEEATDFKDISVYPNPSNGEFYIKIPSSSSVLKTVTITDISGKGIMGTEDYNLDLEFGHTLVFDKNKYGLSKGIYIVTVITNEKTFNKKVVIQ